MCETIDESLLDLLQELAVRQNDDEPQLAPAGIRVISHAALLGRRPLAAPCVAPPLFLPYLGYLNGPFSRRSMNEISKECITFGI